MYLQCSAPRDFHSPVLLKCQNMQIGLLFDVGGGEFVALREEFPGGPLASGNCDLPAMALLTTQPLQKGPHHHFTIQPISFWPTMVPFYRDTRGKHHMRFDTTTSQTARQPKAVATGFASRCERPGSLSLFAVSSRQRCNCDRSSASSTDIFFIARYSKPGTSAQTN